MQQDSSSNTTCSHTVCELSMTLLVHSGYGEALLLKRVVLPVVNMSHANKGLVNMGLVDMGLGARSCPPRGEGPRVLVGDPVACRRRSLSRCSFSSLAFSRAVRPLAAAATERSLPATDTTEEDALM